MSIQVTVNEEKIKQRIAQKIVEYWNGRTVTVSGGVGAHWSDWSDATHRVEGTHDQVAAIDGVITASLNGNSIDFQVDYTITIQNIG